MLSAREWSFALTPCSLALSGLPVSEASPVAGIGKSAAAIAPATATVVTESTAAHATAAQPRPRPLPQAAMSGCSFDVCLSRGDHLSLLRAAAMRCSMLLLAFT